jgi:hypothetical protein
MIPELKLRNPNLNFVSMHDPSRLFRVTNVETSGILALSNRLQPAADNVYLASDDGLERVSAVKQICREVFAELPVQAGWCYGGNRCMNGFEWHKSSEVVVACDDCVLLLGDSSDIKDGIYDSIHAVALFLGKGEAVELLPMTLHLAPLPVGKVFRTAIILPKGTNLPLAGGIAGELRAVNKWLLVHKDNVRGIQNGAKVGIIGENIRLN